MWESTRRRRRRERCRAEHLKKSDKRARNGFGVLVRTPSEPENPGYGSPFTDVCCYNDFRFKKLESEIYGLRSEKSGNVPKNRVLTAAVCVEGVGFSWLEGRGLVGVLQDPLTVQHTHDPHGP